MSIKKRILVLDADMSHTLAVVRSLARCNVLVDIAASVDNAVGFSSRHVFLAHIYPDPLTQERAFCEWVNEAIHQHGYDLVIPVTERTLVPLSQHRRQHPSFEQRITMPDHSSLELALDKQRTFALAEQLQIKVPRSITLHDTSELAEATLDWPFPMVLKPARSVGRKGTQRRQLTVEYAGDSSALEQQAQELLEWGPLIIQEYFCGDGVGIEIVADRGRTLYRFAHRRLHEYPLTGGGSTLRESIAVPDDLAAAADKLVRATNWHGVAMIEFKYQPDTGDYRLMEINGRFWGSLPLATAAGADFPAMLLSLYSGHPYSISPPYRTGVYCRRLETDINWLEAVLRHPSSDGLVVLPSKADLVRDLLLVFSLRHYFDVQKWSDPLPGLIDIKRILSKMAERIGGLLVEKLVRLQQKIAWESGRIARCWETAESVHFVCYGNINRSALADSYLRAHNRGKRRKVTSSGFHPVDGRAADAVMVEVASRNGLDMSQLRSATISPRHLAQADIILVMEVTQLQRLRNEYPECRHRCFLLGAADPSGPRDIADPYSHEYSAYEQCYQHVAASIDGLVALDPQVCIPVADEAGL